MGVGCPGGIFGVIQKIWGCFWNDSSGLGVVFGVTQVNRLDTMRVPMAVVSRGCFWGDPGVLGVFLGFSGCVFGAVFGSLMCFWDPQVNGLDTVRVPMDVVQFLRPKTKRLRRRQEQQRQQLESSRERLL